MSLTRQLKVLESDTEGNWVDTAIKVGFATTDMQTVNQHFGSAQSLAIYAVTMDETKMVEACQFGQLDQDGNEDKLAAKIDALDGCVAIYSQAVGASAVRQLMARGVQPVKVSAGVPISELLQSLQDELRSGPTAWLAAAIRSQTPVDPSRFDEMEDEGWSE